MSAKKFYKKVDISVWFFLMLLPIIVGFINAVGFACNGWRLDESYLNASYYFNFIIQGFGLGASSFAGFIPNFIIDTFGSLFGYIGLVGNLSEVTLITIICSWFVWVVYLHLLVDILSFIPKFFHNFIRKVNKYDE